MGSFVSISPGKGCSGFIWLVTFMDTKIWGKTSENYSYLHLRGHFFTIKINHELLTGENVCSMCCCILSAAQTRCFDSHTQVWGRPHFLFCLSYKSLCLVLIFKYCSVPQPRLITRVQDFTSALDFVLECACVCAFDWVLSECSQVGQWSTFLSSK